MLGLRARIYNLLDLIRESYWFLPLAMAAGAVVVAAVTGAIDVNSEFDAIESIGFGPALEADSARAVLTTIAGSTIGVAGTAFSILIAAVVFASGQFGPRIVGNFMRDRRNQFALGVFLATFVYCLLVLRLVGDDHIPRVSLTTAFLFAIASIAVLIHFFHHAPESIRLSAITANVGSMLLDMVGRRFPEEGAPATPGSPPQAPADAAAITAAADGYVRIIDFEALVEVARGCEACLRVDRMPGDFAVSGRPVAWIWPAATCNGETVAAVRRAIEVGSSRTPAQDLNFLAQQLIDVAERGLSPGINDPRTAMSCLDWIGAALARALRGRAMPCVLCDGDGAARVVIPAHDFLGFFAFAAGQLRPHFQTEPRAALHMMAMLGTLMLDARGADQRDAILAEARRLAEGARASLALGFDADRVGERFAVVADIAAGGLTRVEAMGRHKWL